MDGRLLGVALVTLPWAAGADEIRQLGVHAHGHSTLNIAIEGQRVMIELQAPGMDIVGFEHAARNEPDRAAVARARAVLGDPLRLFVLPPAARCTVEAVDLALAGDDGGEGDRHSEFHAEYTLACDDPDALDTIRFTYFEAFPGAEEIEVNLVAGRGQTSYEVGRDDPTIDLGGLM